MKKAYYTLGVFLMLVAFGCKKDKDEAKVKIIGKWTLVSVSSKVYVDGKEDPSLGQSENRSGNDFLEFKSDGTVTVQLDGGSPDTSNYTISDDGKVLTLDGDETFTVTTLTKTQLVFKEETQETNNGKTYKAELIYTLKK